MSSGGLGIVTGIRGPVNSDIAILTDSETLYTNTKKGFERVHAGEYTGLPGFRIMVGTSFDVEILLALVPPYPQSIVEAVSELYVFGVRRVAFIGRGYRIRKATDPDTVLVAQAAVPLDSTSWKVTPRGVPLLAGHRLLSALKGILDTKFQSITHTIGSTITLDTPRGEWSYSEVEDYMGVREIVAVDSITAPLYAIQYKYSNLEALAALTLSRHITPTVTPVETNIEMLEKQEEKELSTLSKLYLALIEATKILEGGV